MTGVKESGLAYEIKRLEVRMTKKYRKDLRALEDRVMGLEGSLAQVGAWIASKQRAEAQAVADHAEVPVITLQSEEGEVWLERSR